MRTVSIHPPAHHAPTYSVRIGSKIIEELPGIIEQLGDVDRVAILHDERVKNVATEMSALLKNAPIISVQSGESSKNLDEAERICSDLLNAKMSRKSVLVTIGGGMLTDLGGFVASIFQRGIRVIHVPTTLLGMVDAAIGGKTGVDLGHAKNMIGTIHQPAAIVMDLAMLDSLPELSFCEGMVEVIKMAAMLDADAFAWVEKNLPTILKREDVVLTECIARAVHMKAAIIEEDERETGKRMLLNFGHTVGHAVEALSKFTVPHGQAVAIGMVCEMTMAKTPEAERVTTLLRAMKMPTDIPTKNSTEDLWSLMRSDKKSSGGTVRMAVPDRIGHGIVQTVTKDLFERTRS